MRRALLLIGLLPVLLGATFPSGIYDHITKNATCTAVPSDCGVGSEATCSGAGAPCLYTATKMNNVGGEVEAIETALGANLANVLKPGDIDTSAELAAICTNETGTGALVFGTGPTLSGPVIGASTVAGLPTAGTRTGAIYVVTDGTGATPCATGGGGVVVLCRDNGSSYELVGGSSVVAAIDSNVPFCHTVPFLNSGNDNVPLEAFRVAVQTQAIACSCPGATFSTAPQIQFTDAGGAGNVGSALTCGTSGTLSWTSVSGDTDGALSANELLNWSVSNTPSPDGNYTCIVCATFAPS